ncbi:MAG: PDZ domain-containing protein [Gemmataceae bacterium]|nr:PDZ domain-containing protein [Gemmataceae bacterium]
MDFTWTAIAAWLVRAGLGGSLLIVATLLAMRWVRQPARRQRLGELGMAAALVLAALSWAPAWLPLWAPAPVAPPPIAFVLVPAQDLPVDVAAPALTPLTDKLNPVLTPAAGRDPWFDVSDWLLPAAVVAYGLGVAFYLTRWLAGVVALWRIVRASRPATPALLDAFHAGLTDTGKGRRRPRLLISSQLQVPASCGIFRPTVILPEALAAAERSAERGWVFAHELTHLARRDAWSATLFALGQMLYFLLPWFWWLKRVVRLCQEYVADAAAVRQRPADEYAEFLLSLTKSPAAPLAATGVTGTTSDLYRRVTMLLQNPVRVELSCPRRWTVGAAGVLLGLAVVAAGVGPAQADPPNQKEVLEQLERIQDLVNKLRTQIAEQPRTEPAQEARPGVRFELRLKADEARQALEQQQSALRLAQEALQKQAVVQKQAAEHARFAAARALVQIVQAQDPKARVHDDHLKHIIDLLRKHQADLKDEQTRKHFQDAIDRLTDILKKSAATPRPMIPPQPPIVAAPKPPIAADVWRLVPRGAGGDWSVKLWDPHGSPGRLGLRIEAPSAILADQLNLPKDQGLVVAEVLDSSVAQKAGIKANDILLKVNQRTVSNIPEDLKATIDAIKSDTAFDIVVLRRGKQETIKDVKLPEPVVRVRARPFLFDPAGRAAQIAITVTRAGDRITVQRSEGPLVIVVHAEAAGGKFQVTSISIAEKGQDAKYRKVDEVPEAHRAKVRHMLQLLDAPLRTPLGETSKQPGGAVELYYVAPQFQGQPYLVTPRTPMTPVQPRKVDVKVDVPVVPVLPQAVPPPRDNRERSPSRSIEIGLTIPAVLEKTAP